MTTDVGSGAAVIVTPSRKAIGGRLVVNGPPLARKFNTSEAALAPPLYPVG
jgi:hypothetical protein